MRDYFTLGSTPCGEDCAQVGTENYYEKTMEECEKYKELLQNIFPQARDFGTRFQLMSFPHDFGIYHEIVIVFNDCNETAIDFAAFVESNLPENWTDADVKTYEPEPQEEEDDD
jgi:poly(A) polymerase Pap1